MAVATSSATNKPINKPRWLSDKVLLVFLVVWLLACTAIISALSLGHVVALPPPEESAVERFKATLLTYKDSEISDQFVAHILAEDCSCTQSLTEHLLRKGPREGSDELILFVGNNSALANLAVTAGFRYQQILSDELTQMGLESAPVLAVFDGDENLNYLGGYYDHPAAIRPLNESIRDSIAIGTPLEPLPIFGCATSARLQEAFDPLGIVY
jgi:hypothetical protein